MEQQETRLRDAGQAHVTSVFQAVFSKKRQRTPGTDAGAKAGNLDFRESAADGNFQMVQRDQNVDKLALEQTKQYTETLGRWRREVLIVLQDPFFHKIIEAMCVIRAPCIHLTAVLKSRLNEHEEAAFSGPLPRLVCGKAEEIMKPFESMLQLQCWTTMAADLSETDRSEFVWMVGELVIYHLTAFQRRIMARLQCYPIMLFKMAVAVPSNICQVRMLQSDSMKFSEDMT